MGEPPEIADPRPRVVTDEAGVARVAGSRCEACGYPLAVEAPWCPDCRGALRDDAFGPGGTVWAHTTLHISVAGRAPGYTLAYVDIDEGPRILAHVEGGAPSVGCRVAVAGTTEEGDPLVTLA
jgi:uncharacterized OB-fold protein